MKLFYTIFIFCVVLFIYLHIQFHYKTSEDLEVYEVDQPSKTQLEELCDVRQPILFDFQREAEIAQLTHPSFLDATCKVQLREMGEPKKGEEAKKGDDKKEDDTEEIVHEDVILPFAACMTLFQKEVSTSSTQYITENNAAFLQDSGITKKVKKVDTFLRPAMMSHCNYDIMMGSPGSHTPFRYLLSYRNFFIVTEGTVRIKIAPPSSNLSVVKDYVRFEFASPVHPWTQGEFPKSLELTLSPGKTFFLPAYWWYSIRFSKGSSVTCLQYHTYMSTLSILPQLGIYALQLQNIKKTVAMKKKIVEKLEQDKLDEKET
jgi:hypothetical protein